LTCDTVRVMYNVSGRSVVFHWLSAVFRQTGAVRSPKDN